MSATVKSQEHRQESMTCAVSTGASEPGNLAYMVRLGTFNFSSSGALIQALSKWVALPSLFVIFTLSCILTPEALRLPCDLPSSPGTGVLCSSSAPCVST